jgi:hypothetical protein
MTAPWSEYSSSSLTATPAAQPSKGSQNTHLPFSTQLTAVSAGWDRTVTEA